MELREHVTDVAPQSPATIIVPGQLKISCKVTDISEQDATLRVASVFGIPDRFDLMIGEKRYECKLLQKANNRLKVSFRS